MTAGSRALTRNEHWRVYIPRTRILELLTAGERAVAELPLESGGTSHC